MHFLHFSLFLALTSAFAVPDPTPVAEILKRQDSTPTSTGSAAAQIYTGVFTAQGIYSFTSQNGVVAVAGYSLTAGGNDALVGGVRVSVAPGGEFLAGGTSIRLAHLTSASSTTSAASTTSMTTSSTVASTGAAMSTSSGVAAEPIGKGVGAAAVLGGLIGLLI